MNYIFLYIITGLSFLLSNPYKPLDIDFLKETKSEKKETSSKATKRPTQKPNPNAFENIIKGFEKIDGLFTFYRNDSTNQVYLELRPDQFDIIYMLNVTRETGDGVWRHGVSMQAEFPFYFKRIGNLIQLIEKNVKFRSKETSATSKAIDRQIPDSIIRSLKPKGEPNPENNAILIDANKLFVFDYPGISGPRFAFDKSSSFLTNVKSFDLNTEIEIKLNYRTKGVYLYTLADSRNITYTYHYSLSSILQTDYTPRKADDRVGHFQTIYQDYTDILTESPYVRYINRWNLKKKNPEKTLSEPIQPIVFWLENTIPVEFRESITEGILAWNQAFEAIGFKNAIVVRQMPDDADWDPSDVRYSTIRWLIQPGSGIAVGPSRANPFTGELYDADIRISADFVRFFYAEFEEFLGPMIDDTYAEYISSLDEEKNHSHNHECNYSDHLMHDMAFAWNSTFSLLNIPEGNKKKILERFIHDGLVDLLMHEVGHTLGLRHNFKASSIYSLDQISDPSFVDKNGPVGSVMDYNGINLMDGGHNFFQTSPGPYDYWAIEYAYAEKPKNSTMTEDQFVENIASKSTNPLYAYCTDEDSYGTRSIDPYCSSGRDLTGNPIDYFDEQLRLVQLFWSKLMMNFELEGERYPKIRRIFYNGFYEYFKAARNVSKFIGGIEHSRHHVGETEQPPLSVIPANDQRNALKFLEKNIFSSNAFQFSPDLLNKLAPERYSTMQRWGARQLSIPIHDVIKQIHSIALYRVYNPEILRRVQDNEMRFENNNKFTLNELFETMSTIIWKELEIKENVNSYRRNLQKDHLKILIYIMFDKNSLFPNDAVAFSRKNVNKISNKLKFAINNEALDEYTHMHYVECLNSIESAYQAHAILN